MKNPLLAGAMFALTVTGFAASPACASAAQPGSTAMGTVDETLLRQSNVNGTLIETVTLVPNQDMTSYLPSSRTVKFEASDGSSLQSVVRQDSTGAISGLQFSGFNAQTQDSIVVTISKIKSTTNSAPALAPQDSKAQGETLTGGALYRVSVVKNGALVLTKNGAMSTDSSMGQSLLHDALYGNYPASDPWRSVYQRLAAFINAEGMTPGGIYNFVLTQEGLARNFRESGRLVLVAWSCSEARSFWGAALVGWGALGLGLAFTDPIAFGEWSALSGWFGAQMETSLNNLCAHR